MAALPPPIPQFPVLLLVGACMCVVTQEGRKFRSQLLRSPGCFPVAFEIWSLTDSWVGYLG